MNDPNHKWITDHYYYPEDGVTYTCAKCGCRAREGLDNVLLVWSDKEWRRGLVNRDNINCDVETVRHVLED